MISCNSAGLTNGILGAQSTTSAPTTLAANSFRPETRFGYAITAPVVTTNPTNTTVTAGANASFTAAASGGPTPTVQWQVSTDGGLNFTNIGGANAATLSFTTAIGDNSKQYRAVFINNPVGSATTTAATLTVLITQAAWRQTYFGIMTNTGNAVDTADPDGDGYNNLFEYVAGLVPVDPLSRFNVRVQTGDRATDAEGHHLQPGGSRPDVRGEIQDEPERSDLDDLDKHHNERQRHRAYGDRPRHQPRPEILPCGDHLAVGTCTRRAISARNTITQTTGDKALNVPGKLAHAAELLVALGEQFLGRDLAQFVELLEHGLLEMGNGCRVVLMRAAQRLGNDPVDELEDRANRAR